MPPPIATAIRLIRQHREKVIDGLLLVAAVNIPASLTLFPRPGWVAQLMMLLLFAVLVSPRTAETSGPWRRYLRLLPGYVGAAVAGLALFLWWLAMPRMVAWFAPVWLASTALARLVVSAPARRLADHLPSARYDVVALDLCLLAGFSVAAPRWLHCSSPNWLAVAGLAAGWLAWHALSGGLDPAQRERFRRRSALAGAVAVGWGLLFWPHAGAGAAIGTALWLGAFLYLARLAVGRFAADPVGGCAEVVRWIGLGLAMALFFQTFVSAVTRGGGDANYYTTFLADALTQFRHGIFPVFVGQSEYQFNGAVIPIRVAPGFQYLGGLVDLLTGRTLGVPAIQNVLITSTGFACAFASYACLRATTTSGPLAWMLALLFVTCPGVAGLAFNSDLYMSWLAAPWVPVVLYLSWRSFASDSVKLFAALGFTAGLIWWLHAPVALWLTLVAATCQLARLVWMRPSMNQAVRQSAAGAALFLATAAYPVVSAALYPANPRLGSGGGFVVPADQILQQLQITFPAAWLPLSPFGRVLSDFQLGYGLLLLGLVAVPAAWALRRPEARALVAVSALLLLLLLPIPWLNVTLWKLIPGSVRLVTNTWVMQRLYLLLAGCLVMLAAAAAANAGGRARLRWVALAACLWSGIEATKFVRGSWAEIDPAEKPARNLLPENAALTRYSYGLFGDKPSYFTHGVTDPELENRFLAEDLHTVIGGNPEAAARLAAVVAPDEQVFRLADGLLSLSQPIVLAGGHRYLATLTTSVSPFPAATLILKGPTFERVYGLPEYGEAHSFGLGAGHPPFFALHTSSPGAEPIEVTLVVADRALLPQLQGQLSLRLEEYDRAALPVRMLSWLPYTAQVTTAAPVWLETPRMYQEGYRASTDRHPAEVRRSAEGLASVRVPAGTSRVVLRYVAPLGMAAAFWVSLATIAAGAAFGGWTAARQLIARSAAADSPAATDR